MPHGEKSRLPCRSFALSNAARANNHSLTTSGNPFRPPAKSPNTSPMLETRRNFLDVTQSVLGRAWVDRLDVAGSRMATAIAQRAGISDILSRILAGRGVDIDTAQAYLEPTIRNLMPDPSTLAGMDDLADRLAKAITDNESIALFGDYDVDGASSCALMFRFLAHFGLAPQVHIPDRVFEGYGPNIAAMDKLIDAGATLIITLDCGTTSEAPIAHARSRGADVLVIDHHLSDHDLPPANALVNPNRPDDISGLGYLCAVGVTFMVLVAVNRTLRQRLKSLRPHCAAKRTLFPPRQSHTFKVTHSAFGENNRCS